MIIVKGVSKGHGWACKEWVSIMSDPKGPAMQTGNSSPAAQAQMEKEF
jgi:hypothetical protein